MRMARNLEKIASRKPKNGDGVRVRAGEAAIKARRSAAELARFREDWAKAKKFERDYARNLAAEKAQR